MKLGARGKLTGTVAGIDQGAVDWTVQSDLGSWIIVTAVIANLSVGELGPEIGKTAHAIVKVSDVIVAADGRAD